MRYFGSVLKLVDKCSIQQTFIRDPLLEFEGLRIRVKERREEDEMGLVRCERKWIRKQLSKLREKVTHLG